MQLKAVGVEMIQGVEGDDSDSESDWGSLFLSADYGKRLNYLVQPPTEVLYTIQVFYNDLILINYITNYPWPGGSGKCQIDFQHLLPSLSRVKNFHFHFSR
jgi:hypothetical protein